MDEKKEKKSMKNNLEYFWMYYKLPFIAGMIVGILADDLPVLQAEECYTNKETEAAIGIIYNAPHKDEAVKYLLYLAGVK